MRSLALLTSGLVALASFLLHWWVLDGLRVHRTDRVHGLPSGTPEWQWEAYSPDRYDEQGKKRLKWLWLSSALMTIAVCTFVGLVLSGM